MNGRAPIGRPKRAVHRGSHRSIRRGFTLVEVLIVAIVLGILASVVVPTLGNASTPMPRAVADLIELDLRRARIEAIGAVRDTTLAIGQARSSWWIQSDIKPDPTKALPSSMRQLGSGNLAPFAGYVIELSIDGSPAADEDAAIALFDANGTRDGAVVELTLRSSARHTMPSPDQDASMIARWRLDGQRTTLTEVVPK